MNKNKLQKKVQNECERAQEVITSKARITIMNITLKNL